MQIIDEVTAEADSEKSGMTDIVDWAAQNFYIQETKAPIELMPHQAEILRIFTEQEADGSFRWTTLLYSTIKKSGKTTISGLYARWAAENWGAGQEIYHVGNKLRQARERAFSKIRWSIRYAPSPVKARWHMTQDRLTFTDATGQESFIEALPINDAGEAGGNPSLTVWTELWGFKREEERRFWEEMQPVPTRLLSQRFVDSYAGYQGESVLLWELWQAALKGELLHPTLPIYGIEKLRLAAYIDTGLAARRMGWQMGKAGQEYYARVEASERPLNFRRLHLNEWVQSQGSLIEMAVWDQLVNPDVENPPTPSAKNKGRMLVTIGVDAAVSGDSMAAVAVTERDGVVIELETHIWQPDPKKTMVNWILPIPCCLP